METTEVKQHEKKIKPFIHVDILQELRNEREETLDKLSKEEENHMRDMVLANLLSRPFLDDSASTKLKVLKRIEAGDVFSVDEIKAIAQKYALRFAKAENFKAKYPKEALDALHGEYDKDKSLTRDQVYILAPTKAFKVDYYDDPVMFVGIEKPSYGRGMPQTFKAVKKWGNDFTILRRLRSEDYKFLQFMVWMLAGAACIALGVYIYGGPWYLKALDVIVTAVSTIISWLKASARYSKYPEPFFYDKDQWNTTSIRTGP